MSVVALVQMLEFLSKNRPRRTAVFNLNNGEEDQLHGAQAYAAFILLVFLIFVHLFRQILATPVVQFNVNVPQL